MRVLECVLDIVLIREHDGRVSSLIQQTDGLLEGLEVRRSPTDAAAVCFTAPINGAFRSQLLDLVGNFRHFRLTDGALKHAVSRDVIAVCHRIDS